MSDRLVNFRSVVFPLIIIVSSCFILWENARLYMNVQGDRLFIRKDSTVRRNLITFNERFVSLNQTNLTRIDKSFETTVQCIGPLKNQSCLYKNLYYFNGKFTILTLNTTHLPTLNVRVDAFVIWDFVPNRMNFDSYDELKQFVVDVADPVVIPGVTVYFGQPWHYHIAHALFDGLYPAYAALIRFPPRHLHPFRLLCSIDPCENCLTEEIYSRFAGIGIIKEYVLYNRSIGRWLVFDELVMGSGMMCQRCIQPNLQLPGGRELNGSQLFRDRMYIQNGLLLPTIRHNHSAEGRKENDILRAYVVDNKRFTEADKIEIYAAIDEINNYTLTHRSKAENGGIKLNWPLINVTYIYYGQIKPGNHALSRFKPSQIDSRLPDYELKENDFIAQLKLLRTMDIHVTGPGTGQFYQTFLPDGSVTVNLGGLRQLRTNDPKYIYTSFLEQYVTAGTPYIRGLYYPINKRTKGIKRDEVVKLIRTAAQLIMNGFSIPVDPKDSLAEDAHLFLEMCERDSVFCQMATSRASSTSFYCIDLWPEDITHESGPWKQGGFIEGNKTHECQLNHTLVAHLRAKYSIDHYEEKVANVKNNSSK